MSDPQAASNPGRAPGPTDASSIAQQVTRWLAGISLAVAVLVMGAWWLLSRIPFTASTTFIFLFATGGLGVVIHRCLVLGVKRLVRSRIARSRTKNE